MNYFKFFALSGSIASCAFFSSRLGKGTNIVWDLDDTLIKSIYIDTYKDLSKKNNILKIENSVMEHIDDDIMRFHTYLRPYARSTLFLFKWIGAKQYIFTSATYGYMNNVAKFLDPNNNIFESKKLSVTDLERLWILTANESEYNSKEGSKKQKI